MSRPASHSGSWYSSKGISTIIQLMLIFLEAEELEQQFGKWLEEAKISNVNSGLHLPKIIVAPYPLVNLYVFHY